MGAKETCPLVRQTCLPEMRALAPRRQLELSVLARARASAASTRPSSSSCAHSTGHVSLGASSVSSNAQLLEARKGCLARARRHSTSAHGAALDTLSAMLKRFHLNLLRPQGPETCASVIVRPSRPRVPSSSSWPGVIAQSCRRTPSTPQETPSLLWRQRASQKASQSWHRCRFVGGNGARDREGPEAPRSGSRPVDQSSLSLLHFVPSLADLTVDTVRSCSVSVKRAGTRPAEYSQSLMRSRSIKAHWGTDNCTRQLAIQRGGGWALRLPQADVGLARCQVTEGCAASMS